MKYDICKKTAPKMPALVKGTECINLLLSQASKDMHEPLVPMFFPFLAHTLAVQNFSILTSLGRNCAAKWPIWWAKVAATRANCHYSFETQGLAPVSKDDSSTYQMRRMVQDCGTESRGTGTLIHFCIMVPVPRNPLCSRNRRDHHYGCLGG